MMYATDQVSLLYAPEISDRVFSKAISLCFLDALDYNYLTMIFNWSTFDVECLHMLAVFIKKDKRLLITEKKWISITYSIIKASVLPPLFLFFIFPSHLVGTSFSKYNLDCFLSAAFELSMKF